MNHVNKELTVRW